MQQVVDAGRQSLALGAGLGSNTNVMKRLDHLSMKLAARAIIAVAGVSALVGGAAAQTCAKADFEAVVSGASTTLRDMTASNTPTFQEQLRQLKDRSEEHTSDSSHIQKSRMPSSARKKK